MSTPISQLHPHQVLVLINRWIKLKHYWFHEDRDALYKLKETLIKEWVEEGTMAPIKIIQRETKAIIGMREQIEINGSGLEKLDAEDWDERLYASEWYCHYEALRDFANEFVSIPFPPEEQEKLLLQYEEVKQRYESEISLYMRKHNEFRAKLLQSESCIQLAGEIEKAYSQFKSKKKTGDLKEAIKWLNTGQLTTGQINAVWRLINRYSISLEGFEVLEEPQKLAPPALEQKIDAGSYIPGTIPHLDAAIAWAKEQLNDPDLSICDINHDFLSEYLEMIVAEDALETLRAKALEIFQGVLDQRMPDARKVYDALTELTLDYEEAIGMPTHYRDRRRWNSQEHGNYCRWHEINLSCTGAWLVEFQSKVDPSVCLHLPYDPIKSEAMIQSLPFGFSAEESFGREITIAEKREYPIADLLAILGRSVDDFPMNLQKYSGVDHGHHAYLCWNDEEDGVSEFDDDCY